jgi:hypothetical protein
MGRSIDFGMGLGGDQSIEAILAQLTDGLSNGFIIAVGTAPNGSTGQIGTLQVGLGANDITSFDTLVAMQGQNTLDTFPNSGEPTYTKVIGSGSITLVSGTSSSTSEPAGFVYDTGEPGDKVHTGYGLLSSTLSSFVGSDGFLSDGTTMSLDTSGITSFASDYASVASSGNQILVADSSNIAGYVNTGFESYFGESVMFDLADGVIGFKAIACFADGTAIETPQGPVAVDNLAIGDMVTTITEEMREVRWIGYRNVDCWPRSEA